jgi:hypothetical protein
LFGEIQPFFRQKQVGMKRLDAIVPPENAKLFERVSGQKLQRLEVSVIRQWSKHRLKP